MTSTLDYSYYANLPKKRMGAGVIFHNSRGEILIVKPNYKDHWILPGGVVEANESPQTTCIREIKEELGLNIPRPKFLGVMYLDNRDNRGENLQFVFYGGVLTNEQITSIAINSKELDEYRFTTRGKALKLLSDQSGYRVKHCLEALKNNTQVYLEW